MGNSNWLLLNRNVPAIDRDVFYKEFFEMYFERNDNYCILKSALSPF